MIQKISTQLSKGNFKKSALPEVCQISDLRPEVCPTQEKIRLSAESPQLILTWSTDRLIAQLNLTWSEDSLISPTKSDLVNGQSG